MVREGQRVPRVLDGFLYVGQRQLVDLYENFASDGMYVVSGGIKAPKSEFSYGISLTNEDFVAETFSGALIIGRGKLKVDKIYERYIVIWDGEIECEAIGGYVYCTGPIKYKKMSKPFTYVVENCTKLPLGANFYYTTEHGLEVTDEGKGVQVKSLTKESPFAVAGMQVNDIVTRVNGESIKSKYTLYRMIVRALVTDKKVEIIVQRGTDKHLFKVTLPQEQPKVDK